MHHLILTVGLLASVSLLHGQGSACTHYGSENDLLRLNLHATAIIGASSDRDFEHALHHHDPAEEIDLQALEFSVFSNLSTYSQFYSTYNLSEDRGKFYGELEEAYLRLHRLPYGFEAKAGRFIHDIGLQGNLHLHDWDFTNSDLTTALFLGEEGLLADGAEISWYYIYENYGVVGITLAHGNVIEAEEGAGFSSGVTSVRSTVHHYVSDVHQHFFGFSAVEGNNGFGRKSRVLGTDYTYTWSDSKSDIWNASIDTSFQIMHRKAQWQEGSVRGDDSQLTIILSSVYEFSENWEASGRAEWIEGVRDENGNIFVENERTRFSAALTRSFTMLEDQDTNLRLQYNYDKISGDTDAHSLWLQFNFSFGKGWTVPN